MHFQPGKPPQEILCLVFLPVLSSSVRHWSDIVAASGGTGSLGDLLFLIVAPLALGLSLPDGSCPLAMPEIGLLGRLGSRCDALKGEWYPDGKSIL